MNPPSIVFVGGGVHGKVCWLIAYYYSMSRIDFKWWVSHIRPRRGPIYHAMKSSVLNFSVHLDNADLKNLQLTELN